jgi:hypothetical protein
MKEKYRNHNYFDRSNPNKKYVIRDKIKEFYNSITDDEHDLDYLLELRNSPYGIDLDAEKYDITPDQVMFCLELAMKRFNEY